MAASRIVYPADSHPQDSHLRSTSPTMMASSPPTRIRTSGIFTRRLSLTAASVANSVASSSLFGSSPPPAQSSGFYQQSSFFRSSSSAIQSNNVRNFSSINVSSTVNNTSTGTSTVNNNSSSLYSNNNTSSATIADPSSNPSNRRQRTRSASNPPPPPKYKSSRIPQLRVSLQDSVGNLVLTPPVMAPGESIRGQIHLELPKATPVHSIEVLLTGTVTALDGTRLGSMKTVTILEECKTVATASMTNTRTNTTRRHTTQVTNGSTTTVTNNSSSTATTTSEDSSSRGRGRRGSFTGVHTAGGTGGARDGTRSPTAIPIQNTITAAVAATHAAQQTNGNRMSRTFSNPSPYFASGGALNSSTISLNRSMSPTPADLRGRRTSFSANVDSPIAGTGASGGIFGRTGYNMSMVNISTLANSPLMDDYGNLIEDPSLPAAPSYDPPEYENTIGEQGRTSRSEESSNVSSEAVVTTTVTSSALPSTSTTPRISERASSLENALTEPHGRRSSRALQTAATTSSSSPSSSSSSEATTMTTSAAATSSTAATATTITSTSTTTATVAETSQESATTPTTVQPVEPKAVLMQPGNYVIPFSIRIPANTAKSLPGSFSDPVGSISYHLQAVMKQIVPSPDPFITPALVVEPTFTSTIQAIKLIPMNDPTYMPLYKLPFETESVRANVGHWVWSTGFMEAHAWVPKQGFRPGRVVPLVIHIVNHSDARQVIVETTLCKCLHYGSGLTKVRAMGIAGQGYLVDPLFTAQQQLEAPFEPSEDAIPAITHEPSLQGNGDTSVLQERRRLTRRRTSTNRNHRSEQQQQQQQQQQVLPSPPSSPRRSNRPMTPTSEQSLGDSRQGRDEDHSPEGSVNGVQLASPDTSIASSSSSLLSHSTLNRRDSTSRSNSSDGNNTPSIGSGGGATTSGIGYTPESRSTMTSPTPSTITAGSALAPSLPIVQHQREKLTKSKTSINCSLAVDREIQKTIPVPIPYTTGYSILNAPLLEVSYEIVVKIRVEKMYSRGIRLSIPIVVVVPEEGDLDDNDDDLLVSAGVTSPALMARDLGMTFEGDDYFLGDQGECPPYEATPDSGTGGASRRRGQR